MPVDKSGRVFLVGSVPLLHPEVQTVGEMLDGWRNQQLCRNLDHDTIDGRIGLVRLFIAHTNEYPWSWTPAIVEEFFADLRGIKGRAQSSGLREKSTVCKWHAPEFGRYGVVKVRYGKAKKGSPPKRRTVLTVFDWTPDIITDWLTHGQPYLDDGIDLFPSERGALVAERTLLRRFRRYCNDLELSAGLDLHSFRRSYITHLIEDGWDAKFVQDQAGHDYASTTSLYTGVSSDFRTRTLRRVLDQTVKDALSFGEETS